MTRRRRISAKERADIFVRNDGLCHICRHKIDAGRERWDVDHVIPLEMGGEDEGDNLKPAHEACHLDKSKRDMGHIAKGKRMQQRQLGIARQPKNPMPGSRNHRLKKKADGSVVDRKTGEIVWPR